MLEPVLNVPASPIPTNLMPPPLPQVQIGGSASSGSGNQPQVSVWNNPMSWINQPEFAHITRGNPSLLPTRTPDAGIVPGERQYLQHLYPTRVRTHSIFTTQSEFANEEHAKIVNRFMERKGPVIEQPVTERPLDFGSVSVEQAKMITNFYEVQQFLAAQRVKAKEESERKARAKIAAAKLRTENNPFNEDVTKCTICLSALVTGDKVCKFERKHLLHEKCRTDFIKARDDKRPMKCPECRGDAELYSVCRHEGSAMVISDDEDKDKPINRPSLHSFNFPWWENTATREHSYLGEPRLPQGNHGLLVDPGAWSNLVGANWAQNTAK